VKNKRLILISFYFILFFIPLFVHAQTVSPKIINRNTGAPIEINGNIIRQDKHNIGYVRLLQQFNNGKPVRVYEVFSINGTQIASSFSFGKNGHEWMVSLISDPAINFDVNSKEGSDVRDIAAALISHGYL
jgi:hypothetical protein